jgi:hypothetical protein
MIHQHRGSDNTLIKPYCSGMQFLIAFSSAPFTRSRLLDAFETSMGQGCDNGPLRNERRARVYPRDWCSFNMEAPASKGFSRLVDNARSPRSSALRSTAWLQNKRRPEQSPMPARYDSQHFSEPYSAHRSEAPRPDTPIPVAGIDGEISDQIVHQPVRRLLRAVHDPAHPISRPSYHTLSPSLHTPTQTCRVTPIQRFPGIRHHILARTFDTLAHQCLDRLTALPHLAGEFRK